jgi:origin recognition complex subunit 5
VTQAGAAPLTAYPFAARERNVALDLPWFTKFLLIAAYVGSHNPPDMDVRYLTRHASGKTKKRKAGAGAGTPAPTLTGPRPCRHARLLAITHALVSMFDSVAASAKLSENCLLESLNGLMDIHMVARADAPVRGAMLPGTMDRRYVCYAPLRTVAAVAAKVKVDLGIVLHDTGV